METMTYDEAKEHVDAINRSSQGIGQLLLEIRQREGWKALGYKNWTEFLTEEFSYSRKHLYELMKAAPIQEKLPKGYKVNTAIAAKIAEYPEELHIPIFNMATKRFNGKLTESRVASIGDVLQTANLTGYADLGDGGMTALEKAFSKHDEERDLRKKQHIHDKYEDKPQAPLTLSEIQLVISTITANPADQEIARSVRSILRIQERKQAG